MWERGRRERGNEGGESVGTREERVWERGRRECGNEASQVNLPVFEEIKSLGSSTSPAFKPLDKRCQYRLQYVLELSPCRHFEHAYDKLNLPGIPPSVGAWSKCSQTCGGGVQFRRVADKMENRSCNNQECHKEPCLRGNSEQETCIYSVCSQRVPSSCLPYFQVSQYSVPDHFILEEEGSATNFSLENNFLTE